MVQWWPCCYSAAGDGGGGDDNDDDEYSHLLARSHRPILTDSLSVTTNALAKQPK
jgi:hypothetical protein